MPLSDQRDSNVQRAVFQAWGVTAEMSVVDVRKMLGASRRGVIDRFGGHRRCHAEYASNMSPARLDDRDLKVARMALVGNSGSGKTYLSELLCDDLELPYTKLDSLLHNADETRATPQEFTARVERAASGDAWVIDGNVVIGDTYDVSDVVLPRADLIVWLDLPRWRTCQQVTFRTLKRIVVRSPLWGDQRQRWGDLFSVDPHRSPIAWSWTQHSLTRRHYERKLAEDPSQDRRYMRLTSRREVSRFLARDSQARMQ